MPAEMKLLVYTCVFGDYDKVFSPVRPDPGVEYVAITDQEDFDVPGWKTKLVDPSGFASARLANRYYKILGHEVFAEFDASVYVDGNIRVLSNVSGFFKRLQGTDAALGLYGHPARKTVSEEVAQCAQRGQVASEAAATAELEAYRRQGFPDDGGLIEASILLRDHRHPELGAAMRQWWELFETYQSRDQFSLPFVLWKTKVPRIVFPESFRDPNPYFGCYPHVRTIGSSAYVEVTAKSYDSFFYQGVRWLWHLKWKLQRLLRPR